MFKVPGVGFHLFIPYSGPEYQFASCEKQTNFTKDQDIFSVFNAAHGKTFKYGIPCRT